MENNDDKDKDDQIDTKAMKDIMKKINELDGKLKTFIGYRLD